MIDSGYRTSATYRLADPIENMQLEVTLRKRGTRGERRVRDLAAEKPKSSRKPGGLRRGSRRDADSEPDQEELEEPDETAGAPAGAEVEEEDEVVATSVFHWQEKIFSPSEVNEVRKDVSRASRGEGGGGLLARFFSRRRDDFVRVRRRELLGQLDGEAEAAGGSYSGHALHSRVDWENDADSAEWSARFTSSAKEAAARVDEEQRAEGRGQRAEGRATPPRRGQRLGLASALRDRRSPLSLSPLSPALLPKQR